MQIPVCCSGNISGLLFLKSGPSVWLEVGPFTMTLFACKAGILERSSLIVSIFVSRSLVVNFPLHCVNWMRSVEVQLAIQLSKTRFSSIHKITDRYCFTTKMKNPKNGRHSSCGRRIYVSAIICHVL